MKFRTVVELGGKTATGFEVPADVVAALGDTKRPPVQVTVNGHTYRSTVAPMGGRFLVPLSAENRTAAGVTAGEEVDVEIEADTAPREVTVPDDLAAALDAEPAARAFFNSMSYSNKRFHVMQVEGAKTEATRTRRVEKSLTMMREGRAR
ncbi:YdeI/OmpD-associated family protein [Aldersonia sp. NBC_00410]|uniref:YdeI/OmpD-associated family protein n=1 Tax=Aldersonia sp. NBC_00410 TaxID=2975954 RepID=UPI002259FA02|nr:YdeI/OmpD-associated family protein [Aldersonia sp. NBC_00410]MCX5043570.1 YdeI/OmpD-associated family protein [Aldersonia sp. NBC_00410]